MHVKNTAAYPGYSENCYIKYIEFGPSQNIKSIILKLG